MSGPGSPIEGRSPVLSRTLSLKQDQEAQKVNGGSVPSSFSTRKAVLEFLSACSDKALRYASDELLEREDNTGTADMSFIKPHLESLLESDDSSSLAELELETQIALLQGILLVIRDLHQIPTLTNLSLARTLRTQTRRKQAHAKLCSMATRFLDQSMLEAQATTNDSALDEEDFLVSLIFDPIVHDSDWSQSYSVIDIILSTVRLPKNHDLRAIVLHPVILAATEAVWTRPCKALKGRKPQSFFWLHASYFAVYSFFSIILALCPASAHFFNFNPLLLRFTKTRFVNDLIWYFWLVSNIGWTASLVQSLAIGPIPYKSCKRLPLPPSSYVILMVHALLAVFLLLRAISFGNQVLYLVAYTVLAWSMPLLLLAIFVFPAGLPLLSPTAPYFGPARFRALRVLNERIAALSPLVPFLIVTLAALFYAVNGEVERYEPKPSLLQWLITLLFSSQSNDGTRTRTVSPIEARSALAVSFLAVLLLGWLMGDAAISASAKEREAEIDSAAYLERMRTVRLYAPRKSDPYLLPPPWNLFDIACRQAVCFLLALFGEEGPQHAETYDNKAKDVFRAILKPQLDIIEFFVDQRWRKTKRIQLE